jgi:hypothetical protein
MSDLLGSPLIRWQARAALAEALARTGEDPGPAFDEAAGIIGGVVAGLSPQHSAVYLAAPRVAVVLDAVR